MSIWWSEIWFPLLCSPTTQSQALASSIHPTVERVTPATGLASTLRRSASDRPIRPSIASARTLTAGRQTTLFNSFVSGYYWDAYLSSLAHLFHLKSKGRSNPLLLFPVEKSLLLMLGWKFLIWIIDSSWMKLLYDFSSSVGYDRLVVISGRQ